MTKNTKLQELKTNLLNLNNRFTNGEIRKTEILKGAPNYEYKRGVLPIIFSAPHSVYQIRDGVIKWADSFTGALAMYLADKLNCGYMVRTYCANDDPNYEDKENNSKEIKNEYLKYLTEKTQEDDIALIIDLHGASNLHKENVDVIHGKNYTAPKEVTNLIEKHLKALNIKSLSNKADFSGGAVIRQIKQRTGVNAFALEITPSHRKVKEENLQNIESLITAISNFINEYTK